MMAEVFIHPKLPTNYADPISQQQLFQVGTSYSFDFVLTLLGTNLYFNYKLKKEVMFSTRNENSSFQMDTTEIKIENIMIKKLNSNVYFYFQDKLQCHCESTIGARERNGIVCVLNGTATRIGNCSADEWCTGSPTASYSTRISQFCEKGYSRCNS